MIGTYVLSHGYYDAYYLQAQKIRRMLVRRLPAGLQGLRRDCRPGRADGGLEALARMSDDPLANYLADIFTLPASLAGLPGMSVPAGFGAAWHAGSACN
jgi:aspartyl-tRNA(Asn)/glutamyl-tRNA(Gln) amidotransferase subunit A